MCEWFVLCVFLVVGQFHHTILGRRRRRTHNTQTRKIHGMHLAIWHLEKGQLNFVFTQLNTTNNGCRSFSHNIMNLFSASKNHFIHSDSFATNAAVRHSSCVTTLWVAFASACVCEISSQQIRWWMRNFERFAFCFCFEMVLRISHLDTNLRANVVYRPLQRSQPDEIFQLFFSVSI